MSVFELLVMTKDVPAVLAEIRNAPVVVADCEVTKIKELAVTVASATVQVPLTRVQVP